METALEHLLTTSYKADLISYVNSHPDAFEELVGLTLTDKQPYSWRASWLLWSCMEQNDPRIQLHIEEIIKSIPIRSDNQQRELFIILQKMEIDEEFEGLLFSTCVDVWEKINKQASVRHNAFKLIVQIAKKHAELSNEVFYLTQNQYMETFSNGVKKAILKMLN